MAAPFTPRARSAKWSYSLRFAVVTALTFAPASHLWASPQQDDQEVTVTVTTADEKPDDDQVQSSKKTSAPKLWLGIVLKELEGDLASYLDREDGVLIESVFPESPAATAGMKKGDILLRFSSQEVAKPSDVMAVMKEITVNEAGQPQELDVTVLRKGEEVQLTLTPTRRPEKQAVGTTEDNGDNDGTQSEDEAVSGVFSLAFSDDQPFEEVQALIEKMKKGVDNEVQIFQLGSPTIRVSPDGEIAEVSVADEKMEVKIQKNLNGKQVDVTIKRDGEGPATIVVTTDGVTEEYSADQINEMPQELRDIVEPMLTKKGNRVLRIDGGGLKLNATIDEQEVKQMVDKYQRMANEMRRKAKVAAEELRVQAKTATNIASARAEAVAAEAAAAGAVAAAAAQAKAERSEVAQLKQLVEELRTEVKALRQELENK